MHPRTADIQSQLEKILSSASFKDANRARRFLAFIVGESLAGNGDELKENIVGVSVFDRAADYDPRTDSIVRVEAGRLRAKLQEYYSDEGRNDELLFDLPKGGYVPSFAWRGELQSTKSMFGSDGPLSTEPLRPVEASRRISFAPSRAMWLLAVVVVFIGAAVITR